MKKQKAFTTLLGLGILFIAMAIMSGCGKKGDDYSMGIDGYVYVAKQMTTSGEARNFKIKNGYLYWSVDTEYGLDIRRTPIESGFGGEGVLEVPTGISVFSKDTPFASSGCYEVDEEGNLYYVSKSNMLIKQGADGTECYRISVGDGEEKIGSLMAGTQGRLFTATDEYIYVLDARGRIVDEISVGEYTNLNWSGLQEYYSQGTLLKGDDGSMFFLVGSRQCWEIVEENAGGFRLKMWEASDAADGRFMASSRGLMYNEDGILYRCRREDSSYEAVLRWGDSDLSQIEVYGEILWLSDEEIMVSYSGQQLSGMFLLKKTSVEDLPQKEMLIFAVFSPSYQLEQYVMKYNRSNEKYRISMEYYSGEDAWARLDAQIVSSNPPDLIQLYSDNIGKYARKDALEDLMPWLEQSTVLAMEDFPEKILNACTVRGRLVCIPNEFNCTTVVGRSNQVGNRVGWTVEDVKALMEKYPESELFRNMSFPNMVSDFFRNYILEQYIDWERGECYFNGEDFIAFMEWVAGQSKGKDRGVCFEPRKGIMEEKRILAVDADISDLEGLLGWEMFFQEKVTAIGYPSADGSAYHLGDMRNLIGILENSDQKEVAWQFMEAFLADEDMWYSGLPVRKSILQERLEDMTTPHFILDENGEKQLDRKGEPMIIPKITYLGIGDGEIEVDYMTQEQIDQVLDVFYSADFNWRDRLRADILDIIVEEMSPCLKGQKAFKEAAAVVQNRVRNLVEENVQ